MRRLAKYSRDDKYSSRRDYQEITKRNVAEINFEGSKSPTVLALTTKIPESQEAFLGFGVYLKPSEGSKAVVTLRYSNKILSQKELVLNSGWNRIGIVANNLGDGDIVAEIRFLAAIRKLFLWGANCGPVKLPQALREKNLTIDDLNSPYICPECLYLSHSAPLSIDVQKKETSKFDTVKKSTELIELKKCAYCGRHLPIDSSKLGSLAFHKHNAKRTNHQNECRSCKKLRINDAFNPRRTVDQLSESSLITRERKLFLREPEILQRIKDREGAGLKSIVWKRFKKKCFLCKKDLKLSEVELDHTRPIAYLWPIDEHATCLCSTCNNLKREHFPVDVYNKEQLRELSTITGLPHDELRQKRINLEELNRILQDITRFAGTWDPRTFNATRRKILELEPNIDILNVLKNASPTMYKHLVDKLVERPEAVG